jgi:hypothetical protein
MRRVHTVANRILNHPIQRFGEAALLGDNIVGLPDHLDSLGFITVSSLHEPLAPAVTMAYLVSCKLCSAGMPFGLFALS